MCPIQSSPPCSRHTSRLPHSLPGINTRGIWLQNKPCSRRGLRTTKGTCGRHKGVSYRRSGTSRLRKAVDHNRQSFLLLCPSSINIFRVKPATGGAIKLTGREETTRKVNHNWKVSIHERNFCRASPFIYKNWRKMQRQIVAVMETITRSMRV